jgi:eukaryotic-like serine/threonine-protein kinase
VHRDIKPSNVLVPIAATAAGAGGAVHVKLLDIGIAKLLEPELESGTPSATEAGALTPEYAAPEQLTGHAVTTATDVYSLGVLLYLLLSGRHPAGRGLLSPAELISSIVDTEAPRLSDAVTMDMPADAQGDIESRPSTPAAVAARRNTTLEKLRHTLRGDLDTIIAKAMKKNPAERYPSVAAFADDLQRYLEERPIAARPDSLTYRALKFTRRNRISMSLAAAALFALVAGLIGTVTMARRATRQAALAEEQRLRADQAARTASAQRDFTLRQLSQADDLNDLSAFLIGEMAPFDRPFTPLDLVASAEQIAERQQSNDENHVEALLSLAYQYQNLNREEEALRVLQRAYKISRGFADRSAGAKAACALAPLATKLYSRGKEETNEVGEKYLEEAMAALPAEPQYALHRIYCYLRGSETANSNSDTQLAVERVHAAQAILKTSGLSSPTLEFKLNMALAKALMAGARYREGAAAYAEAAKRLTALGRDRSRTAGMLFNNWASSLYFQGRPLEAEPLYRRTFEILSSAEANGRSFLTGWQLNYYARTLAELHRLPEAVHYAEQAYARIVGSTDPFLKQGVLLTKAGIYREMGDARRAEEMLAMAEPIIKPTLTESAFRAMAASERALLAQARGDLPAALSLMTRAVTTVEANPHSSSLPRFVMRRSAIFLQAGRLDEARADADRALALEQKRPSGGTGTSSLGRAYLMLGRVLQAQGHHDQARAALSSALEHLTPAIGADHPETRLAKQLVAHSSASLSVPSLHQVAAR